MNWAGDYPEDFTTVAIYFTTHDSSGAAVAPLTAFEAADVLIYKNGSNAQKTSTNGVTMTSPFDSIVGLHCVTIDTSNDTGDSGFWTTGGGGVYSVVLSPDTETVAGQTVVKVVGTFGIALSPALRPTTAGRTLDVSATGEAGVDWANVGSPTTTLALTGTTIATTQKVDVETIKTNPVVNGGTVTFPTNSTVATTTGAVGSVTGAVGSVTGLTASDVGAIKTKTDFLPSATAGAAGGVFIAGTNAATTITTALTTTFTGNLTGNVGGNVTGSVGSVTGLTASDVGNIKTKTDFLPSATAGAAGGVFIAGTNAATSITTALTANITGNVTGNLSGSVGSVTGAVGSVSGAVGSVSGNVGGNVVGSVGSVVGAVGSVAGSVASVSGNVGGNVVGSVGSVVGAVGSVTGLTASDVGAIKTKTDALPSDPADASDVADLIAAIPANLLGTAVEGAYTLAQVLKIVAAVQAGKTSIVDLGGGAATVVFRDLNDSADRVTSTMAGSERTAVVLVP